MTVDPTEKTSCAKLRYERRKDQQGLFITSDDLSLKVDVEETLGLNTGDLPELRQMAWESFLMLQKKHAPQQYGRPAWAAFFPMWIRGYAGRLPQMLGVIEEKI